ncbi:MAG TPA: DUF4157 domain-containing protein [Kofleriaceae bacterium]|nr:DUF4157 domain-containing protein [Kofleriaceae bacterium]
MKQARSETKPNARAASQRSDASRGQGRQDARAAGTARALRPPPYGIGLVDEGAARIHQVAQAGLRGPSSPLPHLARIQHAFGNHDVTRVQAVMGPTARAANAQLRSVAYASGNGVAFGRPPDLHTAAHEAAHIVQQRAGVQADLVHAGDRYERHANAVADAVVRGRSAAGLLSTMIGRDASAAPVGTPPGARTQPVQLQPEGALRHLPVSSPVRVDVTEIGEYDLLYGFHEYRTRTHRRLDEHLDAQAASEPQPRRLHTIDQYNAAIGKLGEMLATFSAPIGLIRIRNGLHAVHLRVNAGTKLDDLTRSMSPDQSVADGIHAWARGLEANDPAALAADILSDWRLCAWVMMLAAHAAKVGLLDFGGSAPQGGPARQERPWQAWTIPQELQSDRVLDKNLTAKEREGGYRYSLKELISWWCRRDARTQRQAEQEQASVWQADREAYIDLSMWISRQALRRTSKLGIDFALQHLNANLYFNMLGERVGEAPRAQTRRSPGKFGSYLSMFLNMFRRKRGQITGPTTVNVRVSDLVREMAEARYAVPAERSPQPITVSEARYLDELLGRDPSLAGRVRLYNE